MTAPEFITVDGRPIAYLKREGHEPGLIWLGGFRSEMTATKASHLDAFAAREALSFLRFDYGGHGQSGGVYEELTLSEWIADSLGVIRQKSTGPQFLVGSSMGGWIALRVVEELTKMGEGDRVAGLLLIAPAPDFTERLMWAAFPPEVQTEIMETGRWLRPSPYSPEPYPITRRLIEDGRRHLMLERGLDLTGPVHILHGTADPDVPYQLSIELMGRLRGAQATLTLVKDGDHRLSSPAHLAALENAVTLLRRQVTG